MRRCGVEELKILPRGRAALEDVHCEDDERRRRGSREQMSVPPHRRARGGGGQACRPPHARSFATQEPSTRTRSIEEPPRAALGGAEAAPRPRRPVVAAAASSGWTKIPARRRAPKNCRCSSRAPSGGSGSSTPRGAAPPASRSAAARRPGRTRGRSPAGSRSPDPVPRERLAGSLQPAREERGGLERRPGVHRAPLREEADHRRGGRGRASWAAPARRRRPRRRSGRSASSAAATRRRSAPKALWRPALAERSSTIIRSTWSAAAGRGGRHAPRVGQRRRRHRRAPDRAGAAGLSSAGSDLEAPRARRAGVRDHAVRPCAPPFSSSRACAPSSPARVSRRRLGAPGGASGRRRELRLAAALPARPRATPAPSADPPSRHVAARAPVDECQARSNGGSGRQRRAVSRRRRSACANSAAGYSARSTAAASARPASSSGRRR